MEKFQDLAIILKSLHYQDRHRIVTALTEHHGKVTAIARNSIQSKRFGGTLEVFVASRWNFQKIQSQGLATLTEASIYQPFEGLRKDFYTLSSASALTEIMLHLVPEETPCNELFRLHANALWILDHLPASQDRGLLLAIMNRYLVKVIQWSGYPPSWNTCLQCQQSLAECSQWGALYGDLEKGGWLCSRCATEKKYLLCAVTLQKCIDGLSFPLKEIFQTTSFVEEDQKHILFFLKAFCLYHIPGLDRQPLKSFRFLE